jgi:hypothetical protein
MISSVADNEIVSNAQGGKQSRLDYRFDLIDANAMFALAKVMHEGAQNYDVDNWRKIDTKSHLNHAQSHIWAYMAGDKQDEHLSHAFTRLMMALAVSLQCEGTQQVKACHNCLAQGLHWSDEKMREIGDPCMGCDGVNHWKPKREKE